MDRRVDPNGQVWQICQICIEWVRYEDLAIDPSDGLRWDVCATCDSQQALRATNKAHRDD